MSFRLGQRTGRVGAGIAAVLASFVLFGCAADGAERGSEDRADGAAAASPSPPVPAAAPGSSGASPTPQPVEPAGRPASEVAPEPPTSATLPSGAVVPVRAVSTRPDGELDVPEDIDEAGWWRGGSRLGDPFGSTLLAGHVDSRTQGLGAYAELLGVRRDQEIVVWSKSLRQTFAVRSLELVPQGPISDRPDVFSAAGPRRLVLVTCAPPFDRDRGGYQNIVIVTATPVSAPVRKAA